MESVIEEDLKVKPEEESMPDYNAPELEALKALILSEPEMQASKIAFLKEAIAEGHLEIDSKKIAEQLLLDCNVTEI